ncbi:DUF4440 domain-containing protein [Caldalkalibacillus salinus]|uniref:nuclear transport factor 2 family protein n=1 Tax=Caldalkalibacillus salinus TaxID=2803787 RepID=UPI0019235BBB|nr:DUF4440 domain-containing protein [Caldalkalibacillus salinus]
MALSSLRAYIFELEKRLMKYDPKDLDTLLAEDFYEIGSSGQVYRKHDQLVAAHKETTLKIAYTVSDFDMKLLAPDIALVTYQTTRHHDMKISLRSSIWQLKHNQWQMTFHQGTPTNNT